jgi:hypothetical protein
MKWKPAAARRASVLLRNGAQREGVEGRNHLGKDSGGNTAENLRNAGEGFASVTEALL